MAKVSPFHSNDSEACRRKRSVITTRATCTEGTTAKATIVLRALGAIPSVIIASRISG